MKKAIVALLCLIIMALCSCGKPVVPFAQDGHLPRPSSGGAEAENFTQESGHGRDQVPRSQAHFRYDIAAERSQHQSPQPQPRALFSGVHTRHLHPRHNADASRCRRKNRRVHGRAVRKEGLAFFVKIAYTKDRKAVLNHGGQSRNSANH